MGTQAQPNVGSALVQAEQPQRAVAQAETSSTAVAAREKAAVEARYLMALRQPRNPDLARQRLMVRCDAPLFAAVAEYSKPIGGKSVTGASIRLAEEMARLWGNIDVQSTITFDDHERRIVNVSATDLETNFSQSQDIILLKTVERRFPKSTDVVIKTRLNSRNESVSIIEADEEAFIVKQNANISKTRRQMILAVIPGDLQEEALERTRATRRLKDAQDPNGARKAIADSFFRMGVMADQLTEYLGQPTLESITDAQLELLRQIYTAVREGETTWKEVMDDRRPSSQVGDAVNEKPAGKGTSGLAQTLKKNRPEPQESQAEGYRVDLGDKTAATYANATDAYKAIQEGRIKVSDKIKEQVAVDADNERKD